MKIIWSSLGLVLLLIIASLFFGMNKISGGSMEPSFKNGTNVITKRNLFGTINPKRGDVIIFKKDNSGQTFVGRVIVLPKESVRFNKGNVYIKDNTQEYKITEKYLPKGITTYVNTEDGNSLDWINVGEFSYLVLSDKRDNRFNIEDKLINKNNIESVIVFELK